MNLNGISLPNLTRAILPFIIITRTACHGHSRSVNGKPQINPASSLEDPVVAPDPDQRTDPRADSNQRRNVFRPTQQGITYVEHVGQNSLLQAGSNEDQPR